ncbi:response regulator [Thalassoporum mexicanum]|uniref:response regulator n=1 Tax=Thalassoporum mexicanum TaxID=3457544 RepID=UPI00031C4FC6|nr:response regulator [Pseudanabaena sp. PCC 7367]
MPQPRKDIILAIDDNTMNIDDNTTNIEVLSDFLDGLGYEVWISLDGEGALKILAHDQPDLILLDVLMPHGIDGFETCLQIKTNPLTKHMPIVFMTAMAVKCQLPISTASITWQIADVNDVCK